MKALSVRQPWADLIARGAKRIETRSWRTSYRGRLAIHASTTTSMYDGATAMRAEFIGARRGESFRRLPRGCVICTCSLVDCLPVESIRVIRVLMEHRDEASFGDFSEGRWAWLVTDVRRLGRRVPARGRLGLWEWEGPEEEASGEAPGCGEEGAERGVPSVWRRPGLG